MKIPLNSDADIMSIGRRAALAGFFSYWAAALMKSNQLIWSIIGTTSIGFALYFK